MRKIYELYGHDGTFIESIEDTTEWYYATNNDGIDADDILNDDDNYIGTSMKIIHFPSRKVYEPIKQEYNVYLEDPVYYNGKFEIIKYDFSKKMIELIEYDPMSEEARSVYECMFEQFDNLLNIKIVKEPLTLVKYNDDNEVQFLWPEEFSCKLEENETLQYRDVDKLYSYKWNEELVYEEEVLVREYPTLNIVERFKGSIKRMPDGTYWKIM